MSAIVARYCAASWAWTFDVAASSCSASVSRSVSSATRVEPDCAAARLVNGSTWGFLGTSRTPSWAFGER